MDPDHESSVEEENKYFLASVRLGLPETTPHYDSGARHPETCSSTCTSAIS